MFRQILLLTLVSLLSVGPMLWKRGLDIVTRTYSLAAERLWNGENPYLSAPEGTDFFKYSPAFAFLYSPFGRLPDAAQAIAWAAFNAFFFWWGVSVWLRVPGRKWASFWIFWIFAAMELDISLRYQQFNACLVGMTLIGLHAFRDARWRRAAGWLGCAAQLKVLPVVFAAALLWPWKSRYFRYLLLTVTLLCLLPVLAQGAAGVVDLHASWAQLLLNDGRGAGLLDLKSVLTRLGCPTLGEFGRILVLGVTGILFLGARLRASSCLMKDLRVWFAFGICGLLLLSPRTESPTFVLAAPALLICASIFSDRWSRWTLGLIGFAMTVLYTDLWPKRLWDPRDSEYATKTLAILAFWVWLTGKMILDRVATKEFLPGRDQI